MFFQQHPDIRKLAEKEAKKVSEWPEGSYPKWMYHPTKDAILINSSQREEFLGKGYFDNPYDFGNTGLDALLERRKDLLDELAAVNSRIEALMSDPGSQKTAIVLLSAPNTVSSPKKKTKKRKISHNVSEEVRKAASERMKAMNARKRMAKSGSGHEK